MSASSHSNNIDNLMQYDLMTGLYPFIPFLFMLPFDIDVFTELCNSMSERI